MVYMHVANVDSIGLRLVYHRGSVGNDPDNTTV